MSSVPSSGGHGGQGAALYHRLQDKFDYTKNRHYRGLHSTHSKAQNRARKALKLEDTTGLEENDIVKNLTDFMIRYDQEAGVAPKELPDWKKKTYEGRARDLLEGIAKQQKTDLKGLMAELHVNGIDHIFQMYAGTRKNEELRNLHKANMYEITTPLGYDEKLELATELKKHDTSLEEAEPGEIAQGLEELLLGHLEGHHMKTVRTRNKGAKATAGAAHH